MRRYLRTWRLLARPRGGGQSLVSCLCVTKLASIYLLARAVQVRRIPFDPYAVVVVVVVVLLLLRRATHS